jgi:hypothetical protein
VIKGAGIVAEIRFCTAPDGVRLAYSMHGRGPPLIRVATWLTHLELDWKSRSGAIGSIGRRHRFRRRHRPAEAAHIRPHRARHARNAQGACAPDLLTNIYAIRRFLRRCTARPLDDELWSTALCWNIAVPPQVRGALIARQLAAFVDQARA